MKKIIITRAEIIYKDKIICVIEENININSTQEIEKTREKIKENIFEDIKVALSYKETKD